MPPVVRDIPLIMLTSLDGRDAMLDGFSAGADDFISKSSGLDVLKARVSAQIRRKQFDRTYVGVAFDNHGLAVTMNFIVVSP